MLSKLRIGGLLAAALALSACFMWEDEPVPGFPALEFQRMSESSNTATVYDASNQSATYLWDAGTGSWRCDIAGGCPRGFPTSLPPNSLGGAPQSRSSAAGAADTRDDDAGGGGHHY